VWHVSVCVLVEYCVTPPATVQLDAVSHAATAFAVVVKI
jgi:hypothetical protein